MSTQVLSGTGNACKLKSCLDLVGNEQTFPTNSKPRCKQLCGEVRSRTDNASLLKSDIGTDGKCLQRYVQN